MMHKGLIVAGGLLLALAACDDTAADKPKEGPPPAPVAGEYSVDSEVTVLQPADKAKPKTALKVGDKSTSKGCIAADGTPDVAMFAEAGDKCTVKGSHLSGGILSMQYECKRAGAGTVTLSADGNYQKDGFELLVNSATAFPGDGDYALTRHLTAKRIGNCPAAPAKG